MILWFLAKKTGRLCIGYSENWKSEKIAIATSKDSIRICDFNTDCSYPSSHIRPILAWLLDLLLTCLHHFACFCLHSVFLCSLVLYSVLTFHSVSSCDAVHFLSAIPFSSVQVSKGILAMYEKPLWPKFAVFLPAIFVSICTILCLIVGGSNKMGGRQIFFLEGEVANFIA